MTQYADAEEILQSLGEINKEADFSSAEMKSKIKDLAKKMKKVYGEDDSETG